MDFNFNSNRAEAERWLSTAVKLLSAHDLQGTKTFAIRARETDPRLEATDQIIAVADTLLAAESQINSQNQQPDWYAILQLAQYTQNLEIVATQYRRLALLLNPHRNRFPYADHAFRLVSEAWNVLSNPNKKAIYDHELSMFNRFDSPPSGSTQLFERQFLQMHHVQQQSPQPPPPQPLLFHPQPSQLLQFQPQPPPPPQPQPEVQRPQPQWHFQQKRQPPPPPEHQHQQRQQQQQQQNQQYHHEPPQQHRQQFQELPHLLLQQQQQQEVRKNPKSKDGRPSMEEERPIPIPINVTEPAPPPSESTPPPSKSTHAPSESTGPVESTPPSESAPPSELTRPQTVPKSGSFWTSCPYCYNLFEYPSVYEDCMLRCQNCKRAFNAMAIASPPLVGKGGDVNFCCWGYFPLGLLENGKDTGGSSGEWTPFSTMFACPIQGKKNTGRAKIANSGPRVYYDDEEALLDVSDPSEDSDDDEWQRVRRKKKAVKARAKASVAKTPVRASDRIRKGSQNAGGQGKVVTGGGGGVGGGSVSKAESSKKSTSGARKRSAAALGKLDLNVEFSNNEVEEPAAQTMSEGNGTANGEEDNIEGIGPKNSRLVLVAVYPLVRESFKLYADICEVLAVLLDKFFDMEYPDCVKAFDAYVSAAKQIDELVGFYGWCKDSGLARSSEYPEVQRIGSKLLETLEEFVRDRSKATKSPERKVDAAPVAPVEEPQPDMNEIKALPAPESFTPPPPPEVVAKAEVKQEVVGDLVDLRDNGVSADAQGNQLALALFAGPGGGGSANGSWEAFPSDGQPQVTSAWQTPAAEPGKADWELALVETASNLSRQKQNLGGGMDPLLLDGMYDQGIVRQHVSTAQLTGGSASSVALPGPGKSSTQVLALPAPDGTVQAVNQDPFAASLTVPPPSYVQMADLEKKQHLLTQEQQLWNQYAKEGMQGQGSLQKMSSAGYYGAAPMAMQPYGMPPVNGMGMPPPAGYYAPY